MPFTFSVIGVSNVTDPNGAFETNFGSEANSGDAGLGDTLSFGSDGDVQVTIDQDVFGDDNGSTLSAPITLNGTTYGSGTVIETDYSFVAEDPATGLLFRVSHVSIGDEFVGAVISRGFDVDTHQLSDLYTPGNTLEMIDPDDVPSNPGFNAFIQNENFNIGADQLYDNDIDLFEDPSVPICYAAGTAILMADGTEQAVETIKVGDQVLTGRDTPRSVTWIGVQTRDAAQMRANPKLYPVHIRAGALGPGVPRRDLVVSRQHRMVVSSRIARRMFGSDEVLVSAWRLTDLPGIDLDTARDRITYVHFTCDRHVVVMAEGAPSESLFIGPQALQAVAPEARAELISLFPELSAPHATPPPARPIPMGRQQRRLIARHLRSRQPLVRAS